MTSEPLDLDALERDHRQAWGCAPDCTCTEMELVRELRACRAERDDLAEQLDLAFEMQREYLARAESAEESLRLAHITCDKLQAESLDRGARAERAEAELSRFKAFEYADCEATKNRFAAAIARVEALVRHDSDGFMDYPNVSKKRVRAALRGDDAQTR